MMAHSHELTKHCLYNFSFYIILLNIPIIAMPPRNFTEVNYQNSKGTLLERKALSGIFSPQLNICFLS